MCMYVYILYKIFYIHAYIYINYKAKSGIMNRHNMYINNLTKLNIRELTGIVSFIICTCNIISFIYQLKFVHHSPMRICLLNLATVNILIGIFTASAVYIDYLSSNSYFYVNSQIKEYVCKFQYFISTVSLEMNAAICFVIALVRHQGITKIQVPQLRKTLKTTYAFYSFLWITSITFAYLIGQDISTNVCCLPMIFMTTNVSVTFIILKVVPESCFYLAACICYIHLFTYVAMLSKELKETTKKDHNYRGLFLKLCQVIIINICMSLTDMVLIVYKHFKTGQVSNNLPLYIMTFILPLHTILNPVMHSILTKPFYTVINDYVHRLKGRV